ncbi:MAG: cytochrome c, partial [Planctomycetota bacterium]|nr:cytochrome c [Planctomycetota bacterium]
MKQHGWLIALILGLVLLFVGARLKRDYREPNGEIFVEMVRAPAYRSQSANSVLPNGRTLQPPVKGTIPRGFRPIHFSPDDSGRQRAAIELSNTEPHTLEVLERGKHVYGNFCLHCHGRTGRGDGKVAQAAPTLSMAINTKVSYELTDGDLFHIITYGRNNMPPHATQIPQADRWKLIHFLRDLQENESARLEKMGLVFEEQEDPRRHSLVSV